MEEERKIAKYFEIVDLVDRIMPPKSIIDYTTISPESLVAKFEEEVAKSGFYFRIADLEAAKKEIMYTQKKLYERKSVFVSYSKERKPGFDQNNFLIQNNLSEMKVAVISLLHGGPDQRRDIDLIHPNSEYDTRRLGSVEDLRALMTKERISDYVRELLTFTWEDGPIRLEPHNITSDIMAHFGLGTKRFFDEENVYEKISSIITNLEIRSTNFIGRRDNEGNYERAEGNRNRYSPELEVAIAKITDYLYKILNVVLDKTKIWEERHPLAQENQENSSKITMESGSTPSSDIPEEEHLAASEPLVTIDSSKTIEEVPIEDLEALRAKHQKELEHIKKRQELEEKVLLAKSRKAKLEKELQACNEELASLETQQQELEENHKKGL